MAACSYFIVGKKDGQGHGHMGWEGTQVKIRIRRWYKKWDVIQIGIVKQEIRQRGIWRGKPDNKSRLARSGDGDPSTDPMANNRMVYVKEKLQS